MKNVVLKLRPGVEPVSWQDFCDTHPACSIALDGYVRGPTRYDSRGPWLNLDHHEDVDRLATRATCSQVWLCIRQGLFEAFRDDSGRRAWVYANDCDEDVCLSWFLLKNPLRSCLPANFRLERLIHAVDFLDTTAGATVHPLDDVWLAEIAWVFEPYRQARWQGALDAPDRSAFQAVVEKVARRIGDYLADRGGSLPIDTRYERLGGGPGWALVREPAQHSRIGMLRDGIRAYVSVRSRGDGRWAYTIGRASPFIGFDVPAILAELNLAEMNQAELNQAGPLRSGRWGGGNLVGGSPRMHGSALPPSDVARLINRTLLQGAAAPRKHRSPVAPPRAAPASG
jgi:hypothetical protein